MGNKSELEMINKELGEIRRITSRFRKYADSHPGSLAHEFINAEVRDIPNFCNRTGGGDCGRENYHQGNRRTVNPDDWYSLLNCF